MPEPDWLAPVTDLGDGDALEAWRFLAGDKATVRLLTAMGDVFLLRPHGLLRKEQVFLLDTGSGELLRVELTKRAASLPSRSTTSPLADEGFAALSARFPA